MIEPAVNTQEIIAALDAAEASLPMDGPFALTPIRDEVFRLHSASDSFLLKWIAASDRNGVHELEVNRTWLQPSDLRAPRLVATIDVEGGTIACWDWLAGRDLLTENRHRVPDAFAALGGFHARHRHLGSVVSPTAGQSFPSVPDLIAAETDRLLPLLEPSLRPCCAACLARLDQGYGTLIHGDAHPGNIILTEEGFHFVDWSSAVPSLNFFDLEYVVSIGNPQEPEGPYMLPPESTAVLDAYADHCGIPHVDIVRVHMAVMLWRDLYYLESFVERPQRDEKREAGFRQRVLQHVQRLQEGE